VVYGTAIEKRIVFGEAKEGEKKEEIDTKSRGKENG
jgi:hypothetical protein